MSMLTWFKQDRHLVLAVRGAIGGLVAGGAFGALNMWFAADAGLPARTPFDVIATIVQDDARFDAGTTNAGVGLAVHLALSIGYGTIFGLFAAELHSNLTRGIGAVVFGAGLYCLNFLVLAPKWYPVFERTNQPFEGTVHLLFGAMLIPFVARWGRLSLKP